MTIEEAIRLALLDMDAVTAITSTIRPYEFRQSDMKNGAASILIAVESEEFENTVDGRCDLPELEVSVVACCGNLNRALLLSEAIRVNGTDPGTGLHGITYNTGALHFQAMATHRSRDFVAFQDDSENGVYYITTTYYVSHHEVA